MIFLCYFKRRRSPARPCQALCTSPRWLPAPYANRVANVASTTFDPLEQRVPFAQAWCARRAWGLLKGQMDPATGKPDPPEQPIYRKRSESNLVEAPSLSLSGRCRAPLSFQIHFPSMIFAFHEFATLPLFARVQ